MSAELLSGFLIACLLCAIAPGPDNLSVLSLGMSRGRAAAVGFALGCGLGCLLHTLWAVIGVSALIASSQIAFRLLQYAGAAYLVWLGIKIWNSQSAPISVPSADQTVATFTFRRFVVRGLIANALNPKVALFFLAFLPQFVTTPQSASRQIALLGLIFSLVSVTVFSLLGYFSGAAGAYLRQANRLSFWLDRGTACLFFVLAGHLLLISKNF